MPAPFPFCVAVDWGTASLRLWLMAADGTVFAERRSEEGLLAAAEKGFSAILEAHLGGLDAPADCPVVMCGMVGSRSGWVEAPNLDAPLSLNALARHAVAAPHGGRSVRILPGVAQRDRGRPDVMRGEETQILGLGDAVEGLACLPGTHSKWAEIAGGRIERFATFMTGELFALLRSQSVLAGAMENGTVDPAAPAFQDGVAQGRSDPAAAFAGLFALRADWLLHAPPPSQGLARLSGLLIGAEIAGASARFGRPSSVCLVASGSLRTLYETAFAVAGLTVAQVFDAEEAVRRGLLRAAGDLSALRRGAAA